MAKGEKKGRSLALYKTILKLKDLDECCRFFDDLCTPTELRSLEQRFDVAVYLQQGLVYLDILEKTGASSATISRVRRSMLDNGAGGIMREVIQRETLRNRGSDATCSVFPRQRRSFGKMRSAMPPPQRQPIILLGKR